MRAVAAAGKSFVVLMVGLDSLQRHFAGTQRQRQNRADKAHQGHLNLAGHEPTASVAYQPTESLAPEGRTAVQARDDHSGPAVGEAAPQSLHVIPGEIHV